MDAWGAGENLDSVGALGGARNLRFIGRAERGRIVRLDSVGAWSAGGSLDLVRARGAARFGCAASNSQVGLQLGKVTRKWLGKAS